LKTDQTIKTFMVVISLCLIGTLFLTRQMLKNEDIQNNNNELLLSNNILDNTSGENTESTNDENERLEEVIVYDGLTKQELIDKINRNLNSTIAGKGEIFVNYSLELGIDPYLAVAIVLHETGCTWDCSRLVKECNNVGGMKGNNSCPGSSYAYFSTIDEGIKNFMDNLYRNYYAYGLTTPEAINPKYAQSTAWAGRINYYINKIKAS